MSARSRVRLSIVCLFVSMRISRDARRWLRACMSERISRASSRSERAWRIDPLAAASPFSLRNASTSSSSSCLAAKLVSSFFLSCNMTHCASCLRASSASAVRSGRATSATVVTASKQANTMRPIPRAVSERLLMARACTNTGTPASANARASRAGSTAREVFDALARLT